MNTIPVDKKQIRLKIKQIANSLSEETKRVESEQLFAKIEAMPEFQQASTLLIYWSLPDEIPTHAFIRRWKESKKILLPSVKGNSLEIKSLTDLNETLTGDFGILEPDTVELYSGDIDLVLVPGVAFDKKRNRLGRGKGYYDRFLKDKNVLKWGICFHFQLLDKIPADENDVVMDRIITSKITV